MKKVRRLYSDFKPARYQLYLKPGPENAVAVNKLVIEGTKTGRPSHRITLHQKDLKITKAKLTRHDRGQAYPLTIDRINHLPSFQEVRLHSNDILRPGNYSVEVIYSLSPQRVKAIAGQSVNPNREFLPCIDEPEAWAGAAFEVKQ